MVITIINIIFYFLQNCTDNEIVLFPFPEGLHNNFKHPWNRTFIRQCSGTGETGNQG